MRARDAVVAGFLAGNQLLTEQAIEVHELAASGNRVAVRATWRGRTLQEAGALLTEATTAP